MVCMLIKKIMDFPFLLPNKTSKYQANSTLIKAPNISHEIALFPRQLRGHFTRSQYAKHLKKLHKY